MNIISFFRSSQYWQYAIAAWVISFLLLPGSQPQNIFTYIIVIVPMLLTLRLEEIRRFGSDSLAQGLLLVLLTLFATSFIEGSPVSMVKFSLMLIVFYLGVCRVHIVANQTAYRLAWKMLLLLLIYVVVNMLWKYHQGSWIPGMRMEGLTGKLENPIYVTNMMGCMLAIITLTGIELKKIPAIIAAYVIALFMAIAILQTRSILPMTAIMVVITYFSLHKHTIIANPSTRNILMGVAILACIVIGYTLLNTPVGDNLLSRKFYRTEIWQGFFAETVRCGMWLGCGSEHEFHYISQDGHIMVNPHSIFVTQLYKAGVIGLLPLLFTACWAVIYSYKQKYWAGWFFMAGLIGLSIDGSSLVHSPNMRWLVFHLPLALLISKRLHDKYTQLDASRIQQPLIAK